MEINGSIDEAGNAHAAIPDDIIKAAQDAAEKEGAAENGIVVAIKVNLEETTSSLSITLSIGALEALIEAGVIELRIESNTADIVLDLATMKQILEAGGSDVLIRVVAATGLWAADQAVIPNQPVFELSIQSGGRVIPLSSGASVSVSLPYTPAEGENPDNLAGVYVDDVGKVIYLPYSGDNVYAERLRFSMN